ncbi:MAG: hypothetical protein U0Q12_11190 [Vicinamibacterales bacterium]
MTTRFLRLAARGSAPALGRHFTRERGLALVVALVAVLLVSALGSALVSMTTTELRIAGSGYDAEATRTAAHAAIDVGAWAVGRATSLTALLDGSERSTLLGPAVAILPGDAGRRVDVAVETARLQAETTAGRSWGVETPRWRPIVSGPLTTLLGLSPHASVQYVVVWLADDLEGDGNPLVDGNRIVWLHAEAFGATRGHHAVEAALECDPTWAPFVRIVWRRDEWQT